MRILRLCNLVRGSRCIEPRGNKEEGEGCWSEDAEVCKERTKAPRVETVYM